MLKLTMAHCLTALTSKNISPEQISATFINKSKKNVGVYWIDHQGEPIHHSER